MTCAHPLSELREWTIGERTFQFGEVSDNLKQQVICTACWKIVDNPFSAPHLPPTPAITAAESATHAAWKMWDEASDDKEYNRPGCLTWEQVEQLAHDAADCDAAVRKMWAELYKQHNEQVLF